MLKRHKCTLSDFEPEGLTVEPYSIPSKEKLWVLISIIQERKKFQRGKTS